MVYCVSDIHGELDKFERLLQLIRFSDAGQMYILEDVIDRGVMGVDILQRIMAAPNMIMLLGNHEQMCLDTLGPMVSAVRRTCGGRTAVRPPTGSCSITRLSASGIRSCGFSPVCRTI